MISVCEAFESFDTYGGRTVAVRGEDLFNIHSHTLVPYACSMPSEWPRSAAINIDTTGQPYKVTLAKRLKGMNTIAEVQRAGYRGRVVTTVKGRLVPSRRSPYLAELLLPEYVSIEFPDRQLVR